MSNIILFFQGGDVSCNDEVLEPGKIVDRCIALIKLYNAGLSDLCDMVHYGEQILTIAVMAILLTAPLGEIHHQFYTEQSKAIIATLNQYPALIHCHNWPIRSQH